MCQDDLVEVTYLENSRSFLAPRANRKVNEAQVLAAFLFNAPMSRANIVRQLGVTSSAASSQARLAGLDWDAALSAPTTVALVRNSKS